MSFWEFFLRQAVSVPAGVTPEPKPAPPPVPVLPPPPKPVLPIPAPPPAPPRPAPTPAQKGITVTPAILKAIAPNARDSIIGPVAEAMSQLLPAGGISSKLRLAHFLAQAAHESAGFRTLVEYWGPTHAQAGYEGRKDLGNTRPGDGHRFMGRGIFQVTGRANYRTYGKRLGIDLEKFPDRAAEAKVSVQIALLYWNDRHLSDFADRDDVKSITKKINGGYNGLSERETYLAHAKKVLGV